MSFRLIKIAAIPFLALIDIVPMVGVSFAGNEMPAHSASSPQAVKGEVIMITDEFLVVEDPTGKGVVVLFDKDTKRKTAIKVGDKIEAQVSPDGYAESIRIIK